MVKLLSIFISSYFWLNGFELWILNKLSWLLCFKFNFQECVSGTVLVWVYDNWAFLRHSRWIEKKEEKIRKVNFLQQIISVEIRKGNGRKKWKNPSTDIRNSFQYIIHNQRIPVIQSVLTLKIFNFFFGESGKKRTHFCVFKFVPVILGGFSFNTAWKYRTHSIASFGGDIECCCSFYTVLNAIR